MLSSLHIKDFAIIDELDVHLGPGLNIMTGETGAGKTIITQALRLILGERSSADSIRAGHDKASVTAVFNPNSLPQDVVTLLREVGIGSSELIVHRSVSDDGRGKITINNVAVTAAFLRQVTQDLVDISSQHEHQSLLDEESHASVVDAYGSLSGLADAYRASHSGFVQIAREVQALEENERAAKGKLDFLKFQLDELKSADLKTGELEDIESRRSRIKYAVALGEKARAAELSLYGDAGSALERLDNAIESVSQCVRYDPKTGDWLPPLQGARVAIEEVSRGLLKYVEALEADPDALEALEERLHLIRGLVRKHGGSVESCLVRFKELSKEIDKIERYDDVLAEKGVRFKEFAGERRAKAGEWGRARRAAALGLGQAVAKELSNLGMAKTKFEVLVERRPESEWDELGPDHVRFLFSPNPGEPPRPLVRIASGGELSRVMLAMKTVLSGRAKFARTSVFDEVDAGIGGAVADVIGRKLADVAKSRQVICITHLPQVAVHGDCHLRILKKIKGGRTVALLEKLSADGRRDEIARMLGGTKITGTTRAHAEEMLNSVERGECRVGRIL